jgi:hypothetical protein
MGGRRITLILKHVAVFACERDKRIFLETDSVKYYRRRWGIRTTGA